ncbi:MAG: BatA domain-containing protein [Gemmatimonadota bacterium]|nr:BatA domain-containing protein [Gemmatimonadota bacterium]
MGFLAPLFLVGLIGLAIPVLVHLTRHERGKPTPFPSLMFLERIPFQETSRRRIRHWFLLALRLAALALLVAAFARPFFRTGRLASVGGLGPEEVVLLVDRSYSMERAGAWDQAMDRARSAVATLGPLDRLSLIGFDEAPRLYHRSTTDHARIMATLDTLATGSLATRLAPAVRLGSSTLAASTLSRSRVVIISDFQRGSWRGDEEAQLPDGVVLETVPVGDAGSANLALSGLDLDRSSSTGRDRISVSARLVNTSPDTVSTEAVLVIDESQVQSQSVTVAGGEALRIDFAPFTLTQMFTRGLVKVADEGLASDNALNFVLSPGGNTRILVVDPAGAGESNLYLRRALGIAEGSGFQVRVIASAPSAADLDGADAVILNGGPLPGGDAGQRLQAFVQGGGGLLVVSGGGTRVGADHAAFLPVTVEGTRDAGREPIRLGFVDYDHRIFEAFRGARSGDFSRASFYRARSLTPTDSARVLARFDDGTVALAEARRGKGRVLVWASGLSRLWTSLPLQPIYLPLVHELANYLGGENEAPAWHESGATVNVFALAEATGGIELPDDVVAIRPDGGVVGIDPADPILRLDQQGTWEVRSPGDRPDHPYALAVNVDVAESDLTPLDLEELRASIGGGGEYEGESGEDATLEAGGEDFERRQAFWRYLMVAAFLILALESVLANWLSRHTIKEVAGR